MVRRVFFFLIFLVLVCSPYENGYAQEYREEASLASYYDSFSERVDMEHMEEELTSLSREYGGAQVVSFSDVFECLLEGNVESALMMSFEGIVRSVLAELMDNRILLARLLALVIVAAIFSNYSSVLKASFVGEQGFYITYLMIALLLIQSFTLAYDIARDTVYYLSDLMRCMLPALYMSVILCSGFTTSQMVNTTFLWMLSLVERLLLQLVLPGIRIYFLITLLNQLNAKDRFSKLASLLKQGLQFLLKAAVTGIIGLNVMKSILVPVYENSKYNVLQKGLSVIPGGASLSGLSTILVGAGVLIKNSVGITIAIFLLVLCSVPLLKIACFYLSYRVILSLVQPISDNRILKGIQGAADSTGILLRAATTSIVLCVLSIAIILITTNVRLYAG